MNNSPDIVKAGDYVLENTVGSGSFGKVKRACHSPTGCSVAVKIINKATLLQKPDHEMKIRREINNLKKFRHPHIVKLYEVIETPEDIYLVMELVSGGELFDYLIQSGKLNENEGRFFFQQMISAVGYCHKHKVAHRDLKPENLLLSTDKNSLKIADFGLSNYIQDGELLKTSCGSPNYAAPEVIDGKYYSGEEIDVWSSGVILYALLTARLPFDDEYIPHLFSKIKRGKFKMPSYLSGPCQDLIKRMLNVDPLKRITVQEIRQHPWFKENLPLYLSSYLEGSLEDTHERLDPTVLMELEDIYNMDSKKLKMELLKEDSMETNKYMVSYLLLYDRLHEHTKPHMSTVSSSKISDDLARSLAELSTSPPINLRDEIPFLNSHTELNVLDALQVQQEMNASLFNSPLKYMDDNGPKDPQRKLWYLGILSKLKPKDIMDEVFRALKKFNFEWKVLQPYQIQARVRSFGRDDHILLEHDFKHENSKVKIAIQLFKINHKKDSDPMYLLDIKNIQGHPLTFFDHCSNLMGEIHV